jgi:hypothetical protein
MTKIANSKLRELLAKHCRGPVNAESAGFQIRCPWHDDRNPSCMVFYGSGAFFCFICHGDKKKGHRGVGPYRGFKALGMPDAEAKRLFLSQEEGGPFVPLLSPSLPKPEVKKPKVDQVSSREPWPGRWGFRELTRETMASPWFRNRFDPTKVVLSGERLPRLALAVGGAEAFKDTKAAKYTRHEVYLRLSSAVKKKAVNSTGLTLDTDRKGHATLFGLVDNRLSKGSRGLILVEGPYDAMLLCQHIRRAEIGGSFDVAALLGTSQWPRVLDILKIRLLPEMEKKGIPLLLAFDNDSAGFKLTKTAITDLTDLNSTCRLTDARLKMLSYPMSVKDPGEMPFDVFVQSLRHAGVLP